MASFSRLDLYQLTEIKVTKKELGRGSYATVLELDYMGLKCAGKKIHENLLNHGDVNYPLIRFEEECKILSQVRHPNVVQFLGVYFPEGETVPILVMEFLPTSLAQCIEHHHSLLKDISYSILHDIALGLCYLHSQNPPIIHRDLSSNNILLTSSKQAKIADLGVARIIHSVNESTLTKTPGTPTFMPPEAMVDKPVYNASIDVFSYGIIMIHVFRGEWPQPHVAPNLTESGRLIPVTEAERREQHLRALGSDHPMMDLIRRCIKNDPNERAHARDIVKEISKMAKVQEYIKDPLEMMKILEDKEKKVHALEEENEAKVKNLMDKIEALREMSNHDKEIIRKKEEEEIKELQQQLEDLRTPLITTKQPLQGSITWEECSSPPTALAPAQSTVINGKAYFRGSETKYNTPVYCYNPSKDKWNGLPPLTVKEFSLGQIDGMLVAIGGVKYGKEWSKELHTLLGEKKLQRWENVHQPMLTARSLAGVVSLKSGLIVAGGQTHYGRSCTDIEVYNINASQWFKVNQSLCLPIACYNVSLIASQDSIHIIGGQYDQTSRLNKTYSSPVEILLGDAEECIIGADSNKKNKNCWTVRHDTPTYQPVTAMLLNNILAIGGWKNSDSIIFKNNVHMFCTQRETWVHISDLPKGLPLPCSTSASLSPTEILVILGHNVATCRTVYKGSLKVQPCAGEK